MQGSARLGLGMGMIQLQQSIHQIEVVDKKAVQAAYTQVLPCKTPLLELCERNETKVRRAKPQERSFPAGVLSRPTPVNVPFFDSVRAPLAIEKQCMYSAWQRTEHE